MAKKISEKIIEILKQATIDTSENSLTLHRELDRKDYQSVDEVLQSIRGEWNRGAKAHFFPFDPTGPLNEIFEKKELEPKNATAYFPTPSDAVTLMYDMVDDIRFECADASRPVRVLEPSAGIGGIADYIKSKTEHIVLDTVEIHPPNQEILKSKGYNPYCMDFMDFEIPADDEKYDYIIMNPPFSLKGDKHAYITHINHALKMLKHSGELVAIIPTGWCNNTSKKEEAFRNLVASNGTHVETLEAGTFKESGTMIETKVVALGVQDWKKRPSNGFASYHLWEFLLYSSQDTEHHDKYQALIRNDEATNQDFKDFAMYVIKKYAERDIYLSTDHMDDYVKALQGRTKKAELDDARQWVKEKHDLIHSFKFTLAHVSISEMSWIDNRFKSTLSPGLVAHYNQELKEVGLPISLVGKNTVAQETQVEILQSGGNLFDLMSA